jgi:ferredoxin, 2Fe-2S
MVKIRFIEHDGTEHVVEGEVGNSLMQTARDNLVPGIIGDCGGNCSCATCHGYVDAAWMDRLPPRSEEESIMLDGAMHLEQNSRLTCQLKVTREWDGIVVRLPISQI